MPKSELARIIGDRIRTYRKKSKLSQEELAHLSNTHPTYIGQIERGEKNVTIDTLDRIVKALDINLEQLFRFSSVNNKDLNETIYKLDQYLENIDAKDRKNLLKVIQILVEWKGMTDTNLN